MKRRLTIAAVATAAAIGGSCAFLVPAASASASSATHTLRFTSVEVTQVNYSQTLVNVQDKDVNKEGKVIGYDLLHVVANAKTDTAALTVVFADSGGFLYGAATASANPVLHGKVTGGTGIFKGAKGTIVAKNLNSSGTRSAITVTYRTYRT
jgi:hypothetical protein